MGKTRKQTAVWMVFLQGVLLALGVYLAVLLLTALLAVKGAVPEGSTFPVVAVSCVLSALAGGARCVGASPLGRLPSGVLCAAGFGCVLAVVNLLCWEGGITGRGGVLLLCCLGGGVLAGILCGKKGRRVKRKVPRKQH